jgi:hypothetical protein
MQANGTNSTITSFLRATITPSTWISERWREVSVLLGHIDGSRTHEEQGMLSFVAPGP